MAMDVKLHSYTFFLSCTILTICVFSVQSHRHSNQASSYLMCNRTYNCGRIRNIAYPFWGQDRPPYCGSSNQFKLTCQNDTTSITVGQQNFTVVSINPEFYSIKLVQIALSVACPWHFTNTSLDPTLFRFDNLTIQNLTIFYDCPSQVSSTSNITCNPDQKGGGVAFFAKQDELRKLQNVSKCRVHNQILVQGGISEVEEKDGLNKSLRDGFVVQYIANWIPCSACNSSGGICGTAIHDASRFSCHCRNGIHAYSCPKSMPSPFFALLIILISFFQTQINANPSPIPQSLAGI